MVRPSPLTICSAPFSRVVWRCAPMARLFWPHRVPVSCRMQRFATRSPDTHKPTARKPSRSLYIPRAPRKLDGGRMALGGARALGAGGEVRIRPLDGLFPLLGGQDFALGVLTPLVWPPSATAL